MEQGWEERESPAGRKYYRTPVMRSGRRKSIFNASDLPADYKHLKSVLFNRTKKSNINKLESVEVETEPASELEWHSEDPVVDEGEELIKSVEPAVGGECDLDKHSGEEVNSK